MHRWAFSKHDLGWRFREQRVGSPNRHVSRKVRQERAEKWGLDVAASSTESQDDDRAQGQQVALLSEDRISRRRQGVRGLAIPDRQSFEVDRGNYEVGRRYFMDWWIWTILHLPFTGTSERPAAAVQVGDARDWTESSYSTPVLPTAGLAASGRLMHQRRDCLICAFCRRFRQRAFNSP